MKLLVLDRNRLSVNEISETTSGQVNIIRNVTAAQKDQFLLNAAIINDEWMITPNSGIRFSRKKEFLKLFPGAMIDAELYPSGERVIFYVEEENQAKYEFVKIDIRNKQRVVVGNTRYADIYYDSGLPDSPIHLELEVVPQHNKVIVRNHVGTWSYLNSVFFKEAEGNYGDCVYVLGLKIILGKDFVMVNRPNDSLLYRLPIWSGKKFIHVDDPVGANLDNMVFSCSLRTNINSFTPAEIAVEKPPALREPDKQPAILMIGPAITMSGATVLSSMVSVYSIMLSNGKMIYALPTMVMAGSMVLGSLIWPAFSRRYDNIQNTRKNLRLYQTYKKHLDRVNVRIQEELHNESSYLKNLFPTLNDCINKISGREVSLWERSMDDDDFLEMYIGQGNRPILGSINYPEVSELEISDACSDELTHLKRQKFFLRDVPCSISLKKHNITGIIGERERVMNFMRGMLIELVSLHNYDELKIVIIYGKDEWYWEQCKWLPHVWTNDKSLKLMGNSIEEIKEIASYLDGVYMDRKDMDEDDRAYVTPHYLIIAADRRLAETTSVIKELYKNKDDIHFSLIALYDERKYLPKRCTSVVEIQNEQLQIYNLIDSKLSLRNVKNTISYKQDTEALFIQLENVKLDILANNSMLPEMITFFDMFRIGQPAQYGFVEKWNKSDPTQSLAVPIGVDQQGNDIMLDIHEKMHGPHGLIAGMTGSGKSEFIISYIAALAMYYNPQEVAFILIDFKGGGMADVFKQLPHLVGSITNLDGNELNRSLLAIQSELEKRQKLFKETSEALKISNIDIYKYQSLKREGRVDKPLPHLIIISDEFAELKQQQPEFMEQLIRIARIGRSLGVHLILATQKPDGVVDEQIKSNIKFKVCLKVQDRSDSQSVIDCPDAAALVNSGRFYLKVGMNELFELGQSGWSGAPYHPKEYYRKEQDHTIMLVNGVRPVPVAGVENEEQVSVKDDDVPEKQIDALIQEIRRTAQTNQLCMRKLWLDQLPGPKQKEESNLPVEKEPFILNPILGKYDDLKNQTYETLSVPFTYSGNVVVYGVSGSGTQEFVNKVMLSTIERYTPEEVNMYAVDFDSGSLAAFSAAPHVRGVYCSHELEKIGHVLTQIEQELDNRKFLFSHYGGNYQTFINSEGTDSVPNVLLLVHNYPSFIDAVEDAEYRLNRIAREGVKFGIFILITVTDSNSLSFRHVPLYRQIFVLQQNNNDEYYSILGKTNGIFPSSYLGRGIFKRNNTVYEFQTDMIFSDRENVFEAISQYCMSLNPDCSEDVAIASDKTIRLENFEREGIDLNLGHFPIGKDVLTDELRSFDFTVKTFHLIISYWQDEDENWAWFTGVLKHVVKEEVTIYDLNPKDNEYRTLSTIEDIETDIQALVDEVYSRSDAATECIRKGEPIPDFERKVIIIKDFTAFNRDLSLDTKKQLIFLGESVTKNYHFTFIFFDKEEIGSETLFHYCMRQYKDEIIDRGLWLGTSLEHQNIFTIEGEVERVSYSTGRRGYIFEDKKAYLCRLIEKEI